MKKTMAFLTGIVCILSLTACGNDGDIKVSCGTISAGFSHTVGLKSDGTVEDAGWNQYEQCDVSDWKDIIDISARFSHTVGLKSDGTVVAVAGNNYGQCDVSDWTDITAVSAGVNHTVGLKSDGTVEAAG